MFGEWEWAPQIGSCVYFLIADNHLVYVGQTMNLRSRIAHHASCWGDLQRVFWLEMPGADKTARLAAERVLIARFLPSRNGTAAQPSEQDEMLFREGIGEAPVGAVMARIAQLGFDLRPLTLEDRRRLRREKIAATKRWFEELRQQSISWLWE